MSQKRGRAPALRASRLRLQSASPGCVLLHASILAIGGHYTYALIWNTQWDMFLALVGAVLAVATMSRAHDRALEKIGVPRGGSR